MARKMFSRTSGVATAIAAAAMLTCLPAGAAVTYSNATTILTVEGGDAANGLIPYNGYFRYTSVAYSEETTWSIDPVLINAGTASVLSNSLLSSPIDDAGTAKSSASVAGIAVAAATSLVGTTAINTFTFSSTADMTGTTFVFYAENDIFGFADDVAAFSGSIAGGDLKLYMYDSLAVGGGSPGLTVIMAAPTVSGGAALTSFASGIWTGFGEAIELADLSAFSADGSTFVTGPADLGIALAFSLTGTEASVTVTYDTSLTVPPEAGVPEPATLMLIAAGLLGFGATRKRRC